MIVTRNLSGLIFIDFLAPLSKVSRRYIVNKMELVLSEFPHQTKIHAMDESGHVIIERQRLGPEYIGCFLVPDH